MNMKKLLVVDDDKINLAIARKVLGDSYRVILVTNGTQAMTYMRQETCDLILLDINIP